ncbi:MAG: hypothetical protein PHQ43_11340 [Dehalococcoidales bacterium]|nr:hypothetical protein [Dehalococcoidales bacterium]
MTDCVPFEPGPHYKKCDYEYASDGKTLMVRCVCQKCGMVEVLPAYGKESVFPVQKKKKRKA